MIRKGFKMFLNPGMEEEYERRHNALWEEMKATIHQCGGHNYSIFLDEETHVLYGYLEVEDEELWNRSSRTEVVQRWWDYMKDIMETNEDQSPVSIELKPVFYLP